MTPLEGRVLEAAQPAFNEDAFTFIASLALREAGLMIPRDKGTMVFARLNKRLKALGLRDYESYCALLQRQDAAAERKALISILTTNVTSFMREAHHFEMLQNDILPMLMRRGKAGGRVRLWSAGCSSGQEPYTIAMTLLQVWPDAAQSDVRILATDIDHVVLRKASEGVYAQSAVETLPDDWKSRFFRAAGPDQYSVRPEVRKLIAFRELNLMKPWPFSGRFDVIFCRNVVIYFDQETQNALWPRFEEACMPGATLFVGHSERVEAAAGTCFEVVGKTAYRKPDQSTDDLR